MMNRLFIVVFLMFFSPLFTFSNKIEKAFESLKEYNYFDAKEKFLKKIKKTSSPCAFGLATIFYQQDNPFHQIDSAYKYVHVAEASFPQLSEKEKLKYGKYGFSLPEILILKQYISSFYFRRLEKSKSVIDWNDFVLKNANAKELPIAIWKRDSLAFEEVKSVNSSEKYQYYLQNYPQSAFSEEAQRGFYLAQFKEETKSGTIVGYKAFMLNFPENPYVGQAQDQVYKLATEKNTVNALNDFILKNPDNRNKDEAWRRLYQVYMIDYSEKKIEEFQRDFPRYPFKNEIISDLKMAQTELVPVRIESKFGAMDLNGEIVIPVEYDLLGLFNEGLAVVSSKGKYGYINKMNELLIPLEFDAALDFEQGRAVVEKNGKFGLIDRSGKMVLPFEFEDIGTFSEGLIYAQKNGLYGYYDKFGVERIQAKFSDVFSFVNGLANVQIGEFQAIINPNGEFVFPPKYTSIRSFSKDMVVFEENDFLGLMDYKMKVVLPAIYDEIGVLSNGLAIVNLNGKLGYIDEIGQIKIEPKFDLFPNYLDNGQFLNHLAIASSKDKFGAIDKAGKFVIPNVYSQLGGNSNIMAFNKGKLWGYIDQKNKVVIKPNFDWAESFRNQTAIVAKFNQQGVIGVNGETIIPVEFDEISRLDSTHFLVTKENKNGLFSIDGKMIAPPIYDEIRQLNDTFYVLISAERMDYLYLPENKMVRQR